MLTGLERAEKVRDVLLFHVGERSQVRPEFLLGRRHDGHAPIALCRNKFLCVSSGGVITRSVGLGTPDSDPRSRADGRGDASDGQLLVTGRLYSLKRTLEENPDSDFTPYSSAWTYSA